MNFRQGAVSIVAIAMVMSVGTIVAGTIISFFGQQGQTLRIAQAQPAAETSINIVHRMLQDDANGHAKGWDPNNDTDTFNITDSEYTLTSVVVVNIIDPTNGPICQVDDSNVATREFQVVCEDPPANGAAINYAIINANVAS